MGVRQFSQISSPIIALSCSTTWSPIRHAYILKLVVPPRLKQLAIIYRLTVRAVKVFSECADGRRLM
jgi:hypothetical protein